MKYFLPYWINIEMIWKLEIMKALLLDELWYENINN